MERDRRENYSSFVEAFGRLEPPKKKKSLVTAFTENRDRLESLMLNLETSATDDQGPGLERFNSKVGRWYPYVRLFCSSFVVLVPMKPCPL